MTPLSCGEELLLIVPAKVASDGERGRGEGWGEREREREREREVSDCVYRFHMSEHKLHPSMCHHYLLLPSLIVERCRKVVVDLEVLGDNRLKGIPDLDPVKEPLTPVTLVKVVLLLGGRYNLRYMYM